jgi:hypothetical protein
MELALEPERQPANQSKCANDDKDEDDCIFHKYRLYRIGFTSRPYLLVRR